MLCQPLSDFFREMAGGVVLTTRFALENRFVLTADSLHHGTTRMEAAALRDFQGAGQVTAQNDPLAMLLDLRIRDRYRRKEGTSVGMLWARIKLITVSKF